MRRFCHLCVVVLLTSLNGCVTTQAEHLVSPGMTDQQVRKALGEPYSRNRKIDRGVPVDVWLYREVDARPDGTRVVRDSAVTLRAGKVMSVQVLTETPLERTPTPFAR